MNRLVLLWTFLVLMVPGQSQTITDLRKYFTYNLSEDLDFRILSTTDTLHANIYSIVYTSANGVRVPSWLVVPKIKRNQHPAVIFLHGGGQNKNAFLQEAIDLAKESFISLLIDAPPARPEGMRMNYANYSDPRKDFAAYRQTVVDIRRGVDLLQQNPLVDRYRIVFVGFNKGAWAGGILSGVDDRIPLYILIACSPCQTCDLRNSREPAITKIRSSLTSEQLTQYEQQMKHLDPINYLGSRRESQIFFQFADNDPYVSDEMANLAFKTASEPKLEKYYPSTHEGLLTFPLAKTDRTNWLKKQLK